MKPPRRQSLVRWGPLDSPYRETGYTCWIRRPAGQRVESFLPTVEVPSRYRVPTRGESRIGVEGSTVRECIGQIESQYPGFSELVLDKEGGQRRFVRLFLNGDALDRNDLDSPLEPTDTITIMASAAGG